MNELAKLEIFKRLILKDGKGNLVSDTGLVPSHSFVQQFLKWMFANNGLLENVTVTNTAGVSDEITDWQSQANELGRIDAGSADDSYGIVVGTGTNAEANDDYALQTQIAHGVGAGQLDHGAVGLTAPVSNGNVDLVVTRAFTNGSGGQINVREMGVYMKTKDHESADEYICILRDLESKDVPDAGVLTAQYILRTTV